MLEKLPKLFSFRATIQLAFAISFCFAASDAFSQIRPSRDEAYARVRGTFGPPPDFQQISEKGLIWVNPKKRMVVCDGHVALRAGQLEMFACAFGTKEHESVVSVFGQASWVHTALLSVGAEVGQPVQFEPFKPAEGSTIKVYVLWYDADGKKRTSSAQDWILNVNTKETMKLDWVFAGSKFVKNDDNEELYLGDYGDFITVANFPSATLDLAIRSDASNESLQFAPNTDAIPPLFTPVRVVLVVSDDPPRS